jgi:osmotically-inducible protein OsmY
MTAVLAGALALPVNGQTQATETQGSSSRETQAQAALRGGQYDQQIQQEVAKELKKHNWAKDIRASVEDGIVTLDGSVPLYSDKVKAYEKIHDKDRVQGVRNQIAVAGQSVPDAELRDKLAEKLRYDRVYRGVVFNNFELGVSNGVVTISGQARTPTDAASALSIVENTTGVKAVVDEVKVLPTSLMDDETRIRVARAVYGQPSLQKYAMDPQAPIRIVVDNGHVTLYGVVDNAMDKQIAEMNAKQVPNVFSVTDKLVVADQQAK